MHSYGSLFICNASMGAHSFMKATCCLVHCKGQCSRKPSYCNGHDPVCCKRSATTCFKSNGGSMTTIKDRFHCSCMASRICFPWVAKMSGVLSWFLYLMDWFNSSCMPSSMGLNITGRVLNPRWTFMSFPPHILSTALPTQCRFIDTPTWQTTTCTIYRMGMLVLFARFSNNYVPNYQFVGITIYITVITVMSG